jgi:TRAP transporter TAXI family solute receptor
MTSIVARCAHAAAARLIGLVVGAVGMAACAGTAGAQTYGFATLPPGTLNHTTASAVSKVLKEKAGMNVLVQPTAGDNVIIPMVSRGEAEIGIANAPEIAAAIEGGRQQELRLIGTVHPLRTAFWVRKDAPMRSISDLKGKKVAMGYSAMRTIDVLTRAMLATGGLTEKDIAPVLVPNVVRSADDFVSGAADMFFFAFGGPKVREVDATVGGIRVLEIADSGMTAARKISAYGYLTDANPGPVFIGVERPMKVYTFDNVLITHAKVPDELIYKIITTLEQNKAELLPVQPVLREFSAAGLYKKYDIPYHPGALKYFADNKIEAAALQ